MNLQTLGVQEMNAQELTSVEGGDFWDDLTYAAAVYICTGARLYKGLADGFKAGSERAVEVHNRYYH